MQNVLFLPSKTVQKPPLLALIILPIQASSSAQEKSRSRQVTPQSFLNSKILLQTKLCNNYSLLKSSRYSRIESAAAAPSPTALAICMVAPLRTSPLAKIPSTDVSRCWLVFTNPTSSSSTPLSTKNPVFGFSPTNTKTPSTVSSFVSPFSLIFTPVTRPSSAKVISSVV